MSDKRHVPFYLRDQISEPRLDQALGKWRCRLKVKGFRDELRSRINRHKKYDGASPKAAVAEAEKAIDYLNSLASHSLSEEELKKITDFANQLYQDGKVDPLEAIKLGAERLGRRKEVDRNLLSIYLPQYLAVKENKHKVHRAYKALEKTLQKPCVKEHLMTLPVSTFTEDVEVAAQALIPVFTSRFGHNESIPRNTYRHYEGHIRRFLEHVAIRTRRGNKAIIIEALQSVKAQFESRLTKSLKNGEMTLEQLKYVFENIDEKLLPWLVLKSRMGVRTQLLQGYRWGFFNLEKGWARIPDEQTKLKQGKAIDINLKEVPTLVEWIKWAYEIAGKPKPKSKIVTVSQPTATNKLKALMLNNKDFFEGCFEKDLKGNTRVAHNIFRNTFITNAIRLRTINVPEVVEDTHNLGRYYSRGSGSDAPPDATAFFEFLPSDLERSIPTNQNGQ